MSDIIIGGVTGVGIGAALSKLGLMIWNRVTTTQDKDRERITSIETESRTDLKKQIDDLHRLLDRSSAHVERLEKDKEACYVKIAELQERLVLEMQFGAERALKPRLPTEPPPDKLEGPAWSENSEITTMRELAEGPVVAREKEKFAREKLSHGINGRKALIVDDEGIVAVVVKRLVSKMLPGWTIAHETNAKLGLSVLLLDEEISLAIIDIRMPELDGISFIRDALRQRPELRGRIVICTGALVSPAQEISLVSQLGCPIVRKEDLPEELLNVFVGMGVIGEK
jgi:CheY-like chemotaxis protein